MNVLPWCPPNLFPLPSKAGIGEKSLVPTREARNPQGRLCKLEKESCARA